MPIEPENTKIRPLDWTSSLTYQSTPTVRPTRADLRELAWKAEEKNRKLGVTGMLLYDKGRFLQTLEGSPSNIKVLWESINNDPRHSNIEILSEHIIPARLFDGWKFVSRYDGDEADPNLRTAKARHELARWVPTLIDLLLNGDETGINNTIVSLAENGWDGNAILEYLIEPTARALGDAWLSDDCSELDLTIGLSMLQLAGHGIRSTPNPAALRQTKYSILLATAPGEKHSLGTSLLADLFTDEGWHVEMTFPDTDQALVNQLAAQQPDALDIGLSESLGREHSLANLRKTVERSRFAAPDNLTVVSVGGRLFADAAATAENVGADHARKSVVGSTLRLAELIKQKRQLY